MLNKLHVNVIRMLKFHHKMLYNLMVLRKDQELLGVFLVTKGSFQLKDDDMVLENE